MHSRSAAFIFLFVAGLVLIAALLPEESQLKLKQVFLSDEQKKLFNECEQARQQLKKQGLPGKVSHVEFMIRDTRLEKDPILHDLKKCFVDPRSKEQKFRFEIELFSSDYGQQASADLQVQASLFDIKSGNKVAEIGFRLDHAPILEDKQKQPRKSSPKN